MEWDKAWLSPKHLSLAYPTKCAPKWFGPFGVLEVKPDSMKRCDPTFAVDHLRKHTATDPNLRAAGPAPGAPACCDDKGNPASYIERIVAEQPCKYKGKQTAKHLVSTSQRQNHRIICKR